MNTTGPEAHRGLIQSVDTLHRRGVVHTDVRRANVVWNEEVKRLMIIDFEQALLSAPAPRLG